MELVEEKYKQTDIGMIPSDWNVKSFKDICWVNQGLQIPIERRLKVPNEKSKVYITIQFLNEGKEVEYIDEYSNSVCCVKDDILMTRTGNTGIIVHDVEGVFHNNFFKINFDKKQVVREFLIYYLKEKKTQRIILDRAGTSTIPDLNHNDFYSIPIPLPQTKAEQTAIAAALSDADALITSLEKLIAKKQNIKQGAMQQLLTPKENWVVKKLGEIGKTYGGLSGKSKSDFQNGKYPYIPFMNIMSNPVIDTEHLDYVKIKSSENQNKAQKGDLFFNGSSETPEEVGMCSVLQNDVPNLYLNSFCFGFRLYDSKECNGLYLSYFFRSGEGRQLIFSSAQGATRYNLSKNNFLKLNLSLPSAEEQNQIATILSEMDSEIATLKKRLAKAQSIKQGMMQQLLTGKIRLV